MKLFFIPLFIVFAVYTCPAQAEIPEPGALCKPEEQALFSCRLQMSNKLISLCASPNIGKGRGYLQYRAGDFDRVEEEFPKRREEYSTLFNYLRIFPVGTERLSISFVNNNAVYELYSRTDTPPNPPYSERGLRYAPTGLPEKLYRCQEPVIDHMARLEDIFQ